jgi:hypothetical protein
MIAFRQPRLIDLRLPDAAQCLKTGCEQIQARAEGLIRGQERKERLPILDDQIVDRFFLKPSLEMTKQIDRHNFLIGKLGLGVIAQALKTSGGLRIVKQADKQIELNELIFHCKKMVLWDSLSDTTKYGGCIQIPC